jgi:hypothetical protein
MEWNKAAHLYMHVENLLMCILYYGIVRPQRLLLMLATITTHAKCYADNRELKSINAAGSHPAPKPPFLSNAKLALTFLCPLLGY